MPGLDIAFGNGKQARQPRFGGQKVVAVGIQPIGCDGEADGQQLSVRIEKKAKVHF